MRIEIEIPKEFELDYVEDKFKDFFSRVLADIKTGDLCGRYEREITEMFMKAFAESKVAYSVEAVVAELMKLRERDKFGMCYKADEVLSCTMETSCRSCYEELVREIVRNGGKE